MNSKRQLSRLSENYGIEFIKKPMDGYIINSSPDKKSFNNLLNEAFHHLFEKFSIEYVVKEITFSFIAFSVLLYMQFTGKINTLGDFGIIIQASLIFAGFYNLLKASFFSMFPGLLCMSFGSYLTLHSMQLNLFEFITPDVANMIIGVGAFFVALSLIKSS